MNDALNQAYAIVRALHDTETAQRMTHSVRYERGRVEGHGTIIVARDLRADPQSQLHRIDLSLITPNDTLHITAFGSRALRIAKHLNRTGRVDDAFIAAKFVAGTWSLIDMRSQAFVI